MNSYQQILSDILVQDLTSTLDSAAPGHCMRLGGLPQEILDSVCESLQGSNARVVLLSNQAQKPYEVSATKLVELRNLAEQSHPLLVLMPSNLRTGAEDSFDRATFNQIEVHQLPKRVLAHLVSRLTPEEQLMFRRITEFFNFSRFLPATETLIKFLLACQENEKSLAGWGNLLHFLGLLPDSALLENPDQLEQRFSQNVQIINLLQNENVPLVQRVFQLEIEPNTIQAAFYHFLQRQIAPEDIMTWAEQLAANDNPLNLCNWKFTSLRSSETLQLEVSSLVGREISKDDAGNKLIQAREGRDVVLSLRFSTTPSPAEAASLTHFQIDLMQTNDLGEAERVETLVRFKKTGARGNGRTKQIKLDARRIAEGVYYLKFLALDEAGSVLNRQDPERLDFLNKVSSETEDFFFAVQTQDEETDTDFESTLSRRNKALNALQAQMNARLDYLQRKQMRQLPELAIKQKSWSEKSLHRQVFHADLEFSDQRHVYMVPVPRLFRSISWEFLKNSTDLGSVRVNFNHPIPEQRGLPEWLPADKLKDIPSEFLEARRKVFEAILQEIETEDHKFQGVPEVFDYFAHPDIIENYLNAYADWAQVLVAHMEQQNSESSLELVQEFLRLDTVEINLPVHGEQQKNLTLMPPLHPLRLGWSQQLGNVYLNWEGQSLVEANPIASWTDEIRSVFSGQLQPSLQPLVLPGKNLKSMVYLGELAFGWGVYSTLAGQNSRKQMSTQALLNHVRQVLQIPSNIQNPHDVSAEMLAQHIQRFLASHSYVECLMLNFFNSGNGQKIVDCLRLLQKNSHYQNLRYEIRLISSDPTNAEAGQALADFLNPTGMISEEAEAFIRAVPNALFPKIRYSINQMNEYLQEPDQFPAHLSFLFDSFPVGHRLIKIQPESQPSLFLHSLICKSVKQSQIENKQVTQWDLYINPIAPQGYDLKESLSSTLAKSLNYLQQMVAISLAGKWTDSTPAVSLTLDDRQRTMLHAIHQHSNWVVTLDRNLGIEMYDSPAEPEDIPYLLDFKPELKPGLPSIYLTTRPSSEILAMVRPGIQRFYASATPAQVTAFLEVLRSISGSLIMQLASGGNRSIETFGLGLSRLLLNHLQLLDEYLIIPLDMHQDLFQVAQNNSDEERTLQRGDLLLVSCQPEKNQLTMLILEVKCRAQMHSQEQSSLHQKMVEQLDETMSCLRYHYDPRLKIPDRLDRALKQHQLFELLSFYLERAHRYGTLQQSFTIMKQFIHQLSSDLQLRFEKIGMIFEYESDSQAIQAFYPTTDTTIFEVGQPTIKDLMDNLILPTTALNRTASASLETLRRTMTERPQPKIVSENAEYKSVPTPLDFQDDKVTYSASSSSILDESDKGKSSQSHHAEDLAIEPMQPEPSSESLSPEEKKVHPTIIPEDSILPEQKDSVPEFSDLLGESHATPQYGVFAKNQAGRKIALDLNGCNTISLFGVPGSGKSYTLGTIVEMATMPIPGINTLPKPLASVIFHFHESQDYAPEFISMRYPNKDANQIDELQKTYGALPQSLEDIILLVPADKVGERRAEYPDLTIAPIAFASQELSIKDWKFLMGALGNQAMYMQVINMIMRQGRSSLTLEYIRQGVENSSLSQHQKDFALHRLELASQFIDDQTNLKQYLKPGRLVLVDLRDEFIEKDQALGLFVVMLNIFSGARNEDGTLFNKLIVFDEAHKYITHSDLTSHVVDVIRQMRHQGVTMLLASQDPPSLPNDVIELSSAIVLHRFNSPQWLKHIQKSVIQLQDLLPEQLAQLQSGEAYIWASKATHPEWTRKAIKVKTRPRITQHGGGTQQAVY
jgi:DNA phosphorothioation-dependent restriction protein DptH